MSNTLEEYITRDDSEIDEDYNSSDYKEDADNYINNGLAMLLAIEIIIENGNA